jgi:hypothetical protein
MNKIIIAELSLLCIILFPIFTVAEDEEDNTQQLNKIEFHLPQNNYKLSVIDLITKESINSGINPKDSLRIAECESQYGKYKFNWEGGSAKGIYQFTDKTWKHYCEGDVLNDLDNIKCFVKLYKIHPSWWKCS